MRPQANCSLRRGTSRYYRLNKPCVPPDTPHATRRQNGETMNETNANMPQPTELISAEDARALTAAAKPGRSQAGADTLATNALRWAMRNAEGQTSTRIRTYAMYGRTSVMLKFAPGETDCAGAGNAFYNDLLANSNVLVADAISSIIHGRPQGLISPCRRCACSTSTTPSSLRGVPATPAPSTV